MENKEIVAGALRACTKREQVEDVFARFEIDSLQDKIDCLNECMGNPKTFYSAGSNASLETIYELTIAMFLTGAWKVASSGRSI